LMLGLGDCVRLRQVVINLFLIDFITMPAPST
jgi:hypothetical protein